MWLNFNFKQKHDDVLSYMFSKSKFLLVCRCVNCQYAALWWQKNITDILIICHSAMDKWHAHSKFVLQAVKEMIFTPQPFWNENAWVLCKLNARALHLTQYRLLCEWYKWLSKRSLTRDGEEYSIISNFTKPCVYHV